MFLCSVYRKLLKIPLGQFYQYIKQVCHLYPIPITNLLVTTTVSALYSNWHILFLAAAKVWKIIQSMNKPVTPAIVLDTIWLYCLNKYIALITGWTILIHWGRVTHICVSKPTIIGSDNGLVPGRRQAISWTNDGLLLIRTSVANISKILSGLHSFFQDNAFEYVFCEMSAIFPASMCKALFELVGLILI